jgi:hypothetical protein
MAGAAISMDLVAEDARHAVSMRKPARPIEPPTKHEDV